LRRGEGKCSAEASPLKPEGGSSNGSAIRTLTETSPYFFFHGVEVDDWIDRMVAVPTISSMMWEQWIGEDERTPSPRARRGRVPRCGAARQPPLPRSAVWVEYR
jgi:hypothetical protein